MEIIKVENLTKTYQNGKGIFGISFTVKEGEVFGYLGPNGSGKTTTIRQIMGFTNANKGLSLINNLDTRKEAHKIQKNLGYLPGEIAFYDSMSGEEFLDFLQALRQLKDKTYRERLLQRFQLDISGKIRKMSKGMKQKLAIIAAFMHDPKVLILDEPTSGLDPLMQMNFVDLILEEKKRGKTILMSSHNFEEIERTADRVGIIQEGSLVAIKDIHSLKESQRKIFIITVASNEDIRYLQSTTLDIIHVKENQIKVAVRSQYQYLIQELAKVHVTGIHILSQSLEEVFMEYYQKERIE